MVRYLGTGRLEDVRQRLDTVDREIIRALGERLRLVTEVAEVKSGTGTSLRDRDREEEILGRVAATARDAGIDESFLVRVYREIMDHSLRRQQAFLEDEASSRASSDILVVGYQGTEGAYSHVAATRHVARTNGHIYPAFQR